MRYRYNIIKNHFLADGGCRLAPYFQWVRIVSFLNKQNDFAYRF